MAVNLVFALTLVGSLAISLAITVPLTGALIRVRANFNPKSIQLDEEGNASAHTGPVITGFFGMLRRVKKIEGWGGLYKGIMPALIETAILTILIGIVLNSDAIRYGGREPDTGVLGSLFYATVALILGLPGVVITYRSITTPYKLAFFRPLHALRVLLTPTERRRPWTIYKTPGLLFARFLHIAYKVGILGLLKSLLLPRMLVDEEGKIVNVSPYKLAIFICISVFSTSILCPLDVISAKLAIQRNHAAPEYNSVNQEVENDDVIPEEYAEYSGSSEDVIGLRNEKDPYVGLYDCFKRVVDEEGWQALYRVWWLTAIAGLGSVLS
ncbi:hypothetical protein PHLCEN_2v6491 [Hermanssonia centrifuga]|uniref:Mitochondrial carrier n=1 Tax=Hermanssonia centrifuga TaxID=98765 RepID=A0A2R6NZ90_9APHY|nr:hypothetical protein PHLCEN_2v6491 [Hermanssonia centrifuga]